MIIAIEGLFPKTALRVSLNTHWKEETDLNSTVLVVVEDHMTVTKFLTKPPPLLPASCGFVRAASESLAWKHLQARATKKSHP